MPDIRPEGRQRELQLLRKHKESNSMLAIVMAGIAGLFILAVAAVYHYAFDTNVAGNPRPAATASRPAAAPGSVPAGGTAGSAVRAPTMPAETTGSGSAERGAPAKPSPAPGKPSVGF